MMHVQPRHTNYKMPPSMIRTTVGVNLTAKEGENSDVSFPELLNMAGLFR